MWEKKYIGGLLAWRLACLAAAGCSRAHDDIALHIQRASGGDDSFEFAVYPNFLVFCEECWWAISYITVSLLHAFVL